MNPTDFATIGLDVLTKTSLLLAGAALVAFALRRRSAALRHLAWSTALAGALVLPLAASLAPEWTAPFGLPLPLRSAAVATPAAAPEAAWAPAAQLEARAVTVDVLPPLVPAAGTLAAPPAAAPRAAGLPWLLLAWAAGGLLLLGWTVRSHVRAAALVRRAKALDDPELAALVAGAPGARRVRLLESTEIDVPLATGLLRPALVVPAGFEEWSPERRRVVLLHELAHVERGDCLAQLVGRAAVALWWFHPLAWLALSRLRREAEQAADDRVLEAGTRPSEYAAHLLGVVKALTGRDFQPAGLSMAGSQVERRLLALLDPSRSRRRLSPAGLTVCTILVAGAVTALGGLRAEAGPNDEGPERSEAPEERAESWMDKLADHSGPAAAHDALFRLVGRDPGAETFEQAMTHHSAGRYELSVRGFEKAFDAGYRRGTSAYNTACAMARLGRSGRALDWLDIALENGFTRVDLLDTDDDLESLRDRPGFERLRASVAEQIERGELKTKSKLKREPAENRLEALRRENSGDGEAWYDAGYALHSVQDWKGAEQAWRRALELGHAPGNSRYNVACALARQGRTEEALEMLAEAPWAGFSDASNLERDDDLDSIRADPRFARIAQTVRDLQLPGDLNDLDEVAKNRERWAGFTRRTGELARSRPSSGIAWYQHGVGLLRTERYDEAVAAFERSAALSFKEGSSHWNVACAQARAGRPGAALDALEKSLELNPNPGQSLVSDPDLASLRDEARFRALVEEHAHEGHWDKARKHLKKAFERHAY